MENWKTFANYNGYDYQISDLGRIRSVRIRSLFLRKDGYLDIKIGNSIGAKLVHRLVAENFCEKEEGKDYVNHKDGNKKNNCSKNLEWCSASENTNHAIDTGLMKKQKGQTNYNAKLNDLQVRIIRKLCLENFTQQEIAKIFNVNQALVSSIKNKKIWTHI